MYALRIVRNDDQSVRARTDFKFPTRKDVAQFRRTSNTFHHPLDGERIELMKQVIIVEPLK